MPIVPQSAQFPLTLFPPNMPLLLPAPKIAGLLMPPKPPVLTYASAALNTLSLAQQAKLQAALAVLLDAAVAELGSPSSSFDAQAVSRTFWDRLGVGRFDLARFTASIAGWQTLEEMDAELDAHAKRGLADLRARMAASQSRAHKRYGKPQLDGEA